ncbi:hypothetical protein EJ06DRAFT_553510 [Trichodelitschia bisporula]|uniref:Uncharacterized protein n=1 Tax=Trichodelitschia bisporula TaxID=703511 RepID=A0A6G1I9F1_9PEZI|nr:hypothetical protein EJ06DRAFT_553510 [Trichodelitschia bisporula]
MTDLFSDQPTPSTSTPTSTSTSTFPSPTLQAKAATLDLSSLSIYLPLKPYTLLPTPHSGTGVFTTAPLPPSTPLLSTSSLLASTILRAHRREVCAWCLAYDLGRIWPVRPHPPGVFCTEACRAAWEESWTGLGEEEEVKGPRGKDLALASMAAVDTFLARAARRAPEPESQPTGPRPTVEQADDLTSTLDARRTHILRARARAEKWQRDYAVLRTLPEAAPPRNTLAQALNPTTSPDPDVLRFMLNSVLNRAREGAAWDAALERLVGEAVPWRTEGEMHAWAAGVGALLVVLPWEVVGAVDPGLLRRLAGVENWNAFGVRDVGSGFGEGEKGVYDAGGGGDEYLGYGVWPEASYFNHSCAPNVGKRRVGRGWEFWVKDEGRGVGEGEELCISYLGGDEKGLRVEERRERLKQFWGFECACARCVAEARK